MTDESSNHHYPNVQIMTPIQVVDKPFQVPINFDALLQVADDDDALLQDADDDEDDVLFQVDDSFDETDFEFHIPTMNFCGPGTNLLERLEADGITPKEGSKPVDRIDEAALRHDIFYTEHTDARTRIIGDKQMIDEIKSIPNPTRRESIERVIVVLLLTLKRFFTILFFRIIDNCCAPQ